MENEKILNENITVNDEELKEVSGGNSPILGKKVCASCKKNVSSASMVVVNGKAICQECKAKFDSK